eukprot:gene4951-5078_t
MPNTPGQTKRLSFVSEPSPRFLSQEIEDEHVFTSQRQKNTIERLNEMLEEKEQWVAELMQERLERLEELEGREDDVCRKIDSLKEREMEVEAKERLLEERLRSQRGNRSKHDMQASNSVPVISTGNIRKSSLTKGRASQGGSLEIQEMWKELNRSMENFETKKKRMRAKRKQEVEEVSKLRAMVEKLQSERSVDGPGNVEQTTDTDFDLIFNSPNDPQTQSKPPMKIRKVCSETSQRGPHKDLTRDTDTMMDLSEFDFCPVQVTRLSETGDDKGSGPHVRPRRQAARKAIERMSMAHLRQIEQASSEEGTPSLSGTPESHSSSSAFPTPPDDSDDDDSDFV